MTLKIRILGTDYLPLAFGALGREFETSLYERGCERTLIPCFYVGANGSPPVSGLISNCTEVGRIVVS